jgi:PST family polysaccharide transporter
MPHSIKPQRLITNSSWILSERILRIICSLLIGAWVARYLGAELFGLLALAQALSNLFSPLSNAGFEAILVRDIRRDPAESATVLGSAFSIRLCGGVILIVLSVAAAYYLRPGDDLFLALVLIFSFAGLLLSPDVIDAWFLARENMALPTKARGGSLLTGALLRGGAVLMSLPVTVFAGIAAIESAMISLLLISFYRAAGNRLGAWRVSLVEVKRLLRQGSPVFISSIFYLLTMEADKIIVARILGAHAAGIYAAAVRISEIWYFIPQAFIISIYPSLVESHISGNDSYRNNLTMLYGVTALMGIGASLLLVISAPVAVPLLYGSAYTESIAVLMLHAPSGFFLALSLANGRHLLAENMTRYLLIRSTAAGILNIILTCILAKQYGTLGAAVATTVSYAGLVFTLIFFRQTRPHVALCILSPLRLLMLLRARYSGSEKRS